MSVEARGARHDVRARSSNERFRSIATGAAPFLLALVVYTGAWLSTRPPTTGDEPHYLIAAQSLIFDGDFNVSNDYASRERVLRTGCFCYPLAPHAAYYAGHAYLTPSHGLGLPVLLAPAVGLGGLTLARLEMILIAALAADQLFRLLRDLGRARPLYRWLAWSATVLSLPLVSYSSQIFPELPAALVVLVCLRVVIRPRPPPGALLGATVAAAILPWLNVRYYSIFALLVLGLLLAAVRAYGDGTLRARDAPRVLWRNRLPVTLYILVPALFSIVGLALTFQVLYGSPSPEAPFRPIQTARLGSAGWDFWYDYLLADFLSPFNGWIPYAPIAWLALAGLGCTLRIWRWKAGAILIGIAVYLALVASTGLNAGWAFPARFILVFIPLAAVPLAILLEAVWESRILFVPLLAATAYASYSFLGATYVLLYPAGTGSAREPSNFPPVRHWQTAFPNVLPPVFPTQAVFTPGEGGPVVGRLEHGKVVATAGDRPGYLINGMPSILAPGLYTGEFSLSGDGVGTRSVGRIEVMTDFGRIIAQRDIRADELTPTPKWVALPFATPGGVAIDARVWFAGGARLSAGPVTLDSLPGTVPPSKRFADLPLTSIWVGGTVFFALLFAQLMALRGTAQRTRHRPERRYDPTMPEP